jgi:ribosomal protein S18 acetylase RimI-like enzyme
MEPYVVRRASAEDAESLANLRLALQKHLLEANPNLWQLGPKRIRDQAAIYRKAVEEQNKRIVLVETSEGEAVGMAIGSICDHAEYVPERSGKIDDLWVAPGHRRCGLAKLIIGDLLGFFRDHEVQAVVLDYAVGNAEADALWLALGLRPTLVIATSTVSEIESRL